MASLKEVKTRINSVKSTRKITSAMKMVASAKLHKAQGAIENMLPYQKKLNKILTNFLSADLPIESPYIRAREVKRVAIIAFSSNTSLCGAFNANVIKMLLQTVSEYRTLGQDNILIFPIGKKVEEAVKRMGFQPGESLLGKKVDYVFLGACTNGRIEDFRAFASIVKGRKKADNITAWLVPGSWMVDEQIRQEGLDKVLEEAGFEIRQPGCSACLAMNDDKIPAGKYSVSTSNRNFEGRQGPGSRTLLASPLTAAAAAVTGVITDPRTLM